MLAAQFLNVVIEEHDKNENNINDVSSNDYSGSNDFSGNENDHESNNNTIYDIISQLDIKAQLAKILLSECTIEPSKIAMKREKPVLSFEANVTPIYDVPPKKPKANDELSILNAVEAVYSDGEGDDSPTVPCPVCNRSFSRNCSLALHMKSHEPLEEVTKRLYIPNKLQQQQQSLKKPPFVNIHRSNMPPTSMDKYPDDALTRDCMITVTPSRQETEDASYRRFKCTLCPRTYSQKSVLKKHLAVHTGERERCNICGAGFSQRSSLVRHAKRIHGGLLNRAISGSGHSAAASSSSLAAPTPILTTALSGLTHPTLGTPLIVGIPLNHLAAGKYAGTPLAAAAASGGLVVKSPAQLNSAMAQLSSSSSIVPLNKPAIVPLSPPLASTSAQ